MTNTIKIGVPSVSNWGGPDGQLPAATPSPLKRTISLTIERDEESDPARISVNGSDYFPPHYKWVFDRHRAEKKVREYCQFLRQDWTNEIVQRKQPFSARYELDGQTYSSRRNGYPFLDNWNHDAQLFNETVGPALAVAGQHLYRQLFRNTSEKHYDNDESQGNRDARSRFLDKLEEALQEEQVITVHASCFYVPWRMLYTHPFNEPLLNDGSNFDKSGFWGYRHIIEHCPYNTYGLNRVIRPDSKGRVTTGFHVDDGITLIGDSKVLNRQRQFIAQHPLVDSRKRQRTLKKELGKALQAVNFDDQLMYFFCHGHGAGDISAPNLSHSWLKLSDPPPNYITVNDFEKWLGESPLENSPFVFCNACQGGQMNTLFYESVAQKFLEYGASGLIGPQIDMPIVFAEEFGRRFFDEFLGDGQGRGPAGSAGTILRDLTREFINKHFNPLGLAYSLYSGADMQVVPKS